MSRNGGDARGLLKPSVGGNSVVAAVLIGVLGVLIFLGVLTIAILMGIIVGKTPTVDTQATWDDILVDVNPLGTLIMGTTTATSWTSNATLAPGAIVVAISGYIMCTSTTCGNLTMPSLAKLAVWFVCNSTTASFPNPPLASRFTPLNDGYNKLFAKAEFLAANQFGVTPLEFNVLANNLQYDKPVILANQVCQLQVTVFFFIEHSLCVHL